MARRRALGSTYRLQLHGLGFARARRAGRLPGALGVETLYVSPVLRPPPGSTHGYDVADVTRLDPALGGATEFEALLAELEAHGMRLLLDVVPNHMAADTGQPLVVGRAGTGRGSSPCGTMFDIDWEAQDGKVLLPVLGSPLGRGAGRRRVGRGPGRGPSRRWSTGSSRFPLRRAGARPAGPVQTGPTWWAARRQHYRLAYWRLGHREGNYRRFFDVDGLVGVRVEEPAVLRATHRLFELAADPGWPGCGSTTSTAWPTPVPTCGRLSGRELAAGFGAGRRARREDPGAAARRCPARVAGRRDHRLRVRGPLPAGCSSTPAGAAALAGGRAAEPPGGRP